MLERVAAFDGDSTMIRILFADGDLVLEDFADDFFADDVFPAFLLFAGAFFSGGDDAESGADFSGTDSNTSFALFADTFFFVSSVFGEDAFLTGEILITPICFF